jgi:hypothetical protein
MNRRDFLKLGGLFSTVFYFQVHPLGKLINLPVEVEVQGLMYRGATDGNIYLSRDAGKTWQVHTRFGAGYSIQSLFVDWLGRVCVRVGFAGHSFDLFLSKNGAFWQTT